MKNEDAFNAAVQEISQASRRLLESLWAAGNAPWKTWQ